MLVAYRRVWKSPALWLGYLLTGVLAPWAIFRSGLPGLAVFFAALVALILLALLFHVERKPSEAAEMRAIEPTLEPEPDTWRWWIVPLWAVFSVSNFDKALSRRDTFLLALWGVVLIFVVAILSIHGWRWWRNRALTAD